MFESTLSINNERKEYLDFIYNQLKPHIKLTNSVVASSEGDGRTSLSIACEDEFKDNLHIEIVENVAEVFAIGFKYEYLKEKLNIASENLLIKTLLNTMTVFDSNNDKKLIKKSLWNESVIALDGFFDFRLQNVKKKWDEIINLTNDNSIVFTDEEISCEFLMFLLDAIPHGADGVKVCRYGNKIEFFDKKGKHIRLMKLVDNSRTTEEVILFNLICIAPQKVLLSDEDAYSKEFIQIVKKFF